MKKIYFFVPFLFLGYLGLSQSFHTIDLNNGLNSFTNEETYNAPDDNNVSYKVAYDETHLYFGVYRLNTTFGNSSDAFTLFIDTDPNGANGSTLGNTYNNVTPTLPFAADYAIRVEQNYNELRSWTGANWSTISSLTDVQVGNDFRVFKIAKVAIGNPEFIRFTMWMGYDGGHFAEVPVDKQPNDNNFTNFFGTTAINRAGANPSKVVDTNGIYLLNASGTIASGEYSMLEITGNAVLGANIIIAEGGSMVFRNAASTLDASSNNITFNNWAGIQTETTQPTTITGTGDISFLNGGISLRNNLASGAQVILDLNTTVTGSLFSYQLQANKTLQVNTNGRSLGTTPFYGTSSTLHLVTNELTPANLWSSNSVSSNVGVPHNVIIDQNLSLDGNRFINGYLRVDSGNVLLNNNRITFNASASNTAVLGPVLGTLTGGEFSTSRFIPSRADGNRAFRLLSSPVNGNSIYQSLQNNGVSQSGFDTQITGGTVANGFDQSATNNPSMFKFLNQSVQWSAVTNTQTEMFNAGMPYRVFVRGDRTIDLSVNGTAINTTLRATGAPVTGTVTYDGASVVNPLNSASGAFNFIGNPYQAQVDMRKVLNASTSVNPNAVYVWDPTLNTRGAYVTVIIDADDMLNGTPSNPSSDANQFLQPWQSVFLVNPITSANTAVVFQEDFKELSTSNTAVFSTPAASNRLSVELLNSNGNSIDAAQAFYASTENAGIDDRDLVKLGNIDENISWNMQGAQIAILRHAIPVNGEQFPLQLTSYRAQNYSLRLNYTSPVAGMNLVLVDNYLQTETLVSGQTVYPFNVDQNSAASAASGRFYVKFENTTLGTGDSAFAKAITLYPNPVTQGMVQVNNLSGKPFHATIYNMLGQEMLNIQINNDAPIDVTNLKPGHYLVRIEQQDGFMVEKLIMQ